MKMFLIPAAGASTSSLEKYSQNAPAATTYIFQPTNRHEMMTSVEIKRAKPSVCTN